MAERTISELEAAAARLPVGGVLKLTPFEQRLWADHKEFEARESRKLREALDKAERLHHAVVRSTKAEIRRYSVASANHLERLPLPGSTVTRLGVRSIDKLLSMSMAELRATQNLGPRSIQKLVDWAERAGVKAAFLPDQPEALHGKAFPWAHLQDAA